MLFEKSTCARHAESIAIVGAVSRPSGPSTSSSTRTLHRDPAASQSGPLYGGALGTQTCGSPLLDEADEADIAPPSPPAPPVPPVPPEPNSRTAGVHPLAPASSATVLQTTEITPRDIRPAR